MAITFSFCFLWISLSLDLQDLSHLLRECNFTDKKITDIWISGYELNPILLLSSSREIALYTTHSCPKSPSSVSIYRFCAQDISTSKGILLRKAHSIVWEDRGTPALNLCCARERWILVLSEWQLKQKNGKMFIWCWAKNGILKDSLVKLKCFI